MSVVFGLFFFLSYNSYKISEVGKILKVDVMANFPFFRQKCIYIITQMRLSQRGTAWEVCLNFSPSLCGTYIQWTITWPLKTMNKCHLQQHRWTLRLSY